MWLAAPQIGQAQSGANAGVGIAPAMINEKLDPGATHSTRVEVSNLSDAHQTFYLFTRDIVGVENGGTPIFAKENQEKTGYEMSDWINLSTEQIDLAPQAKGYVDVTIKVPNFATPGSHFAGIFVSIEPPKLRSTGASVAYQVADIVSVRVAGDVVENAEIRQFSTGNYIYGASKVDFHAKIENKGTVLVQPVGLIEISNMLGKQVASLRFNESGAFVFPHYTREFLPILWEGEGPGFGRYRAILTLSYGEQGQQKSMSTTATFWILPKDIIVPALIALGVLLLVAYVTVKLYVRRKLQVLSAHSHRIVRRRRGGGGMSALLLVVIVMLVVTALFLLVLLAVFA